MLATMSEYEAAALAAKIETEFRRQVKAGQETALKAIVAASGRAAKLKGAVTTQIDRLVGRSAGMSGTSKPSRRNAGMLVERVLLNRPPSPGSNKSTCTNPE